MTKNLTENTTLDELATKEVLALLNQQQDIVSKTELLATLYCRKSEITSFLGDTYSYSPENFVNIFMDKFKPFLRELPYEYSIDLSFTLNKIPDTDIPTLRVITYIISREAEQYSQGEWLNSRDDPKLKQNYNEFLKEMRENYSVIGERLGYAGLFDFNLSREKVGECIFDFFLLNVIELQTRNDYPYRSDEEVKKIIPTALKWGDGYRVRKRGQTLSMSDVILNAIEMLSSNIANDANSLAIGMTTSPTGSGDKLMKRHDYGNEENISSSLSDVKIRSALEKSQIYQESRFHGRTYKLIHLPS